MESVRNKANALLQTNPYDVEHLLPLLETCVESECKEGWYDPDLNTAVLKMYQVFPHDQDKVVKMDILVKILIKAMMQLPEPDFFLNMMLVPEAIQELEVVKTLCDMADRLQTARFPEFWDLVRSNPDLARKAVGFENASRKFILRSVSLTYREMNGDMMTKYLGLESSADLAGSSALDAGLAFDLTSIGRSGVVILPSNSDNHPKSHRIALGDVIKLDALSNLVLGLERSNKNQPQQQQEQLVSSGARNAVGRMLKAMASTESSFE